MNASAWRTALLLVALAAFASQARSQLASSTDVIVINANAPSHPFSHFWEEMFGSGRAILSLRQSYRQDLRAVKQITNFQYVRFHAILQDEVGVYEEDAAGRPVYNFSYLDQIYDGLLSNGVKPFIELSFMPNKLAAQPTLHSFWYRQNISPPKDWTKWDDLITAFTRHLVERYGIDEVSQWYFEVWNEPNLDFWAGQPKQATYWELYDHSALAVKSVDARLRVGGPATAQAAWVAAFIEHCADKKVPLDFVSTHIYGDDPAENIFGSNEPVPRDQMVCRAAKKVADEIKGSSMPGLPLIFSEYNATYMTKTEITDSSFMGPWLADTIRQCDGLTEMMSYWTFSDVFEEQGVVKTPFYGGYGLIAEDGIPKPAFNAFKVLHELGERRISLDSDSILVTRRKDGALVLAVWNYAPPGNEAAEAAPKTFSLHFKGVKAKQAIIARVDREHGDVRDAYQKMGSPRYPTQSQIAELRRAGQLPPPEVRELKDNQLILTLPPHGLATVEVK